MTTKKLPDIKEMLKHEEKKLKDPYLIHKLIKDIQKTGVSGEEHVILVLIMKIMLRLVKNSEPTSSNFWLSDKSGAGKDAVMKRVINYMVNKEDYIHRTELSPKVLKFWNRTEDKKKEETNFNGKVLYLEDPQPDTLKSDLFRTLSAGKIDTSTVIDNKRVDLKIKGKPVMIITSMRANIDEEGTRRWDNMSLDTSPELTKKYLKDVLRDEDEINGETDLDETLRSAIQSLPRQEVYIPYKKFLRDGIKTENHLIRTNIHKLLDYIKASAVLHQKLRARDEKHRVIATVDDYHMAIAIFSLVRNIYETPAMSTAEREIFKAVEKLQENPKYISNDGMKQYGVEISDIVKECCKSKSTVYEQINNMLDKGILRIGETRPSEYEGRTPTAYKIREITKTSIPKPRDVLFRVFSDGIWKNLDMLFLDSKEGFSGFSGFFAIFKQIDKERMENGLKPVFTNIPHFFMEEPEKDRTTDKTFSKNIPEKDRKKGGKSQKQEMIKYE